MSVAAAAACRVPVPVRAPSRSLLRFLRLQSEIPIASKGLCHDIPLLRPKSVVSAQNAGRREYIARRWSTRKLSTSCPHQHADPKSLNLETRQSPRCFSKKLQTPSTRRCFGTTGAAYKVSEPDTTKTAHATSWQERLWGSKAKTGKKPLQPDDLPSHENLEHGSMFTSRRTLAAKAAAEPRLRCTEVDEYGKAILVDGEFKKSELIAKYGLLPRDLRKIDSSNLPHILVRPSAILLNLLHLKVLIKHDRVLLFDVYGSKTSYSQSAFMYDLQGKLQQKSPSLSASGGLPYEFRALETVLTSVTSELEADFEAVREPVMHILSELEDDIDRQKLRMLLILSKRVSTFEQKAKLVRDAIEELLEADDDLAAMYLTEKTHDIRRGMDDHTEVEMLLESYHKLTDEIVQEAGNLVSGIRNTEEIVRAILDANRNALMLLDLKFSVGTLGLAMGTFIAGLYGMNLENFIEETDWGFGGVTGASIIFSLFVCWYGLGKLRKVQRIKMGSEERPHLPRRQIFNHRDDALGLLDATHRERLRRINMQKTAATKKKWWSLRF